MDLYVNIVVCVPRLVLDGDFNAHSARNSIREFLGVTTAGRERRRARLAAVGGVLEADVGVGVVAVRR